MNTKSFLFDGTLFTQYLWSPKVSALSPLLVGKLNVRAAPGTRGKPQVLSYAFVLTTQTYLNC